MKSDDRRRLLYARNGSLFVDSFFSSRRVACVIDELKGEKGYRRLRMSNRIRKHGNGGEAATFSGIFEAHLLPFGGSNTRGRVIHCLPLFALQLQIARYYFLKKSPRNFKGRVQKMRHVDILRGGGLWILFLKAVRGKKRHCFVKFEALFPLIYLITSPNVRQRHIFTFFF